MLIYFRKKIREEGGNPSNELMTTNVSVIPRAICNISYYGNIGRHVFCAGSKTGGKDSCQVRSFMNVITFSEFRIFSSRILETSTKYGSLYI